MESSNIEEELQRNGTQTIKREFPDGNDEQVPTWEWPRLITTKQEPGLEREIKIEKEPVTIDLTGDEIPASPKRPRLRGQLLHAIYQHQKDVKMRGRGVQKATESLFVQNDDPSGPNSPNSGGLAFEPGEGDDSGWMEFESDFKSLAHPSAKDRIEFQKRKQAELDRRRKAKVDKLFEYHAQTKPAEDLFHEDIAPNEESASGVSESEQPHPTAGPRKALNNIAPGNLKVTRLTKGRVRAARNIALNVFFNEAIPESSQNHEEMEVDNKDSSSKKTKKRGQNRRQLTTLSNQEIRSIFENESGYKNREEPLLPALVSTERNKSKAFAEMIASIPTEERGQARTDIAILDEATKTFNPSARSDGEGKWKIRGLKTPLMVNQILAAAWMCKRETCESKPDGGLLCDVMGFGKTLSALACIVNRKLPSEKEGPTLIVAPRNLMLTWYQAFFKTRFQNYSPSIPRTLIDVDDRISQIRQHCVHGAAGSIVGYYSGAHLETDDLSSFFREQGIVVTTYQEICASYPVLKPPPEIKDTAVEGWWESEYDLKAGPFHKILWHRIILDEAHIIRNRDTKTSIAVRALSAKFKWALTGTPLHNCVEEFYSLFSFIGVPKSLLYHEFTQNYCDGTEETKQRLINVLRAIIHRKTHESLHLGRPLITLPKSTMREVFVEFHPPEKLIYHAIAARFLEQMNETEIERQTKCILTMILKLQMFASHPLTAQDYLQKVCKLSSPLVKQLKTWVKDEESPRNPSRSSKIVKCCLNGKYQIKMPMVPLTAPKASGIPRPRPPGQCEQLAQAFQKKTKELMSEGQFYESDNRTWFCPSCSGLPTRAIITSCYHLYCEECFDALDDGKGDTDGVHRECRICKIRIVNAAFYGLYDDIDTPTQEGSEPTSIASTGQEKRKAPQGGVKAHKRRKRGKSGGNFSAWMAKQSGISIAKEGEDDNLNEHNIQTKSAGGDECRSEGGDSHQSEDDPEEDWIDRFGDYMPGAKFNKLTDQIKQWFAEDETAKIVIFTQYLNTTTLLVKLCQTNKWEYAQITGRMGNKYRETQLERFRENDETRIMIASLKTGGLGLDFSVANKCILIDLWWNEAVQDQAFFRLWRIGQKREVECIMILIKESIDEWMFAKQKKKAVEISQVMSLKVLTDRSTIQELLEMFGEVTYDPKNGFHVDVVQKAVPKDKSKGKGNQAGPQKQT
ncbi:hypothetical protein N7457_004026 [Penicillium paradoxum]|uniref:uncharacterized protein n=1 Tax=Penicillium paradoxum TaxID=176176 RepID=UPI0025493143|nr:uncharacterized protein N7457_004026 [Penicillium paradoxum]KAJ5782252.1 hypothetical protein N7457_004026 [Penicillium paradoxum]